MSVKKIKDLADKMNVKKQIKKMMKAAVATLVIDRSEDGQKLLAELRKQPFFKDNINATAVTKWESSDNEFLVVMCRSGYKGSYIVFAKDAGNLADKVLPHVVDQIIATGGGECLYSAFTSPENGVYITDFVAQLRVRAAFDQGL